MAFSRQEYWSGLSFPPQMDLSDPGIEPVSPALAGGCFTTAPPGVHPPAPPKKKPQHKLASNCTLLIYENIIYFCMFDWY